MLLAVTPSKSRSRAMASLSNGNPLPASAPEPRGNRLARRRASPKRSQSLASISK